MKDGESARLEKRGKAPLFLFLAATLLVVGLVALTKLLPKPPPPKAEPPAPVPVTVEIVRPVPKMPDDFELPAVIEPKRVVRVSAEVAGRIQKVCCKEGAFFEKGTVVAELNTDILQAEFDHADAAAGHAALEHARIVGLQKQGAATSRELDAAAAALRTGEAALKLARARLDRSRIKTPISGVLNDLLVEEGEYVRVGDAVAEIVEIDTVKVVAHVPELDVPFLKLGDAVEVFPGVGRGAKTLAGTISYISELADESTRSTRVEIALDNRKRRLRNGQIVRVRLVRRTLANVVLVPLAAVIPLETGKAVYIVEKDKAMRLAVRVNTRFIRSVEGTAKIQILPAPEGGGRTLRAGDALIVAGQQLVAPGQRVKIIPNATDEVAPAHAAGGETAP